MDDVTALLQEARAAGLRVEAAGDRLEVRGPKSAEPIVRRLRAAKAELLRLLTADPGPEPALTAVHVIIKTDPAGLTLDPQTLRETLGSRPDPGAVAAVRDEVLAAVREMETEIQTGDLGAGLLLVRGRPLADWLPLEEVARRLRSVPWRTDAGAATWPATLPDGPKTLGAYSRCAECGAGSWVRYGATVLCLACARQKAGG